MFPLNAVVLLINANGISTDLTLPSRSPDARRNRRSANNRSPVLRNWPACPCCIRSIQHMLPRVHAVVVPMNVISDGAALYSSGVLEATAGARPNLALDAWTRKTRGHHSITVHLEAGAIAEISGLSDPSAYFAGEPNRNVRNLAAWVSRQVFLRNNPLLRRSTWQIRPWMGRA